MSTWWNEIAETDEERLAKERGCRKRFPVAEDIYNQLEVLNTGWSDLTQYNGRIIGISIF